MFDAIAVWGSPLIEIKSEPHVEGVDVLFFSVDTGGAIGKVEFEANNLVQENLFLAGGEGGLLEEKESERQKIYIHFTEQ